MKLPTKEKWLWLVPLIAVLLLWEFTGIRDKKSVNVATLLRRYFFHLCA